VSTPDAQVLVVGGGIAGLAAARELQAQGLEVRLVEPRARPGGVLWTQEIRGYRVECGPNAFRVKADCADFLLANGLAPRLVRAGPESRLRFLWREGRLLRVPSGPLGFATTELLSRRGKLRLLAEPGIRRGDAAGESVAGFVSRRLGREALERLVAPFLTGVYAGDEEQLGAEAVFPSLVAAERACGSVTAGLLASALGLRGERTRRGWPGSWSGRGGLRDLAQALADGLASPPELRTRAREIRREQGVWRVELESASGGPAALRAQQLVIATPAPEAAALLAPVDADAAGLLAEVPYAPLVAVALGARRRALARPVRGFGFLVPRTEDLGLLGCLFMSRVFPDRAPEGCELLHCLLGGVRWPAAVEAPDAQLEQVACEALDRVFGLRDPPERLLVARWPRAVPQPDVRHGARMAALRDRLRAHPGLFLAGSYVDGVAVGDSLLSGVEAARSAAGALPD
jgi:oxygen-dependent protoporphyrinogen oxidase